MTHPLDIVAYLKGEQSFLRATLVVLIGNALAAVTYIGLVFCVLSTIPDLPNPVALHPVACLGGRWAIVPLVIIAGPIWILGRCSSNIRQLSGRIAAYLLVGVLVWAWVSLAQSVVKFMGMGYVT